SGGSGKPPRPLSGRLGLVSSALAGHRKATTMMASPMPPKTNMLVLLLNRGCAIRIPATARIHTRLAGTSAFQPNRMNWSYRRRGSVPRSQMNTNSRIRTLTVHSRIAYQLGAPSVSPNICHVLPCACASTICEVDIEPAVMNTATMDRPIATSYEIICAAERRLPSSGYVEPDAQPASTTPYTPMD